MKNILTIAYKELRDTVRDRRTLLSMVVVPLFIMPLIIVGMGYFIEYQTDQLENKHVNIAVEGPANEIGLEPILMQDDQLSIVNKTETLAEMVRNDEIDAGILIPEDAALLLQENVPVKISIYTKSTSTLSSLAASRIQTQLSIFNNSLLENRFTESNISLDVLTGLTPQSVDVATPQEISGFGLGSIIPLFIVLWSIAGGQYVAIDVSAGEKERKTLEALLLSPASRFEIVAGKFLAVAVAAFLSVVLSITSLYVSISYFAGDSLFLNTGSTSQVPLAGDILQSLSFFNIVTMFTVSILLVTMFSAILLSIAIFAKSYKEAQSYIGPAYMFVVLPITFINLIPNLEAAGWLYLIPPINAVLLFKDLFLNTATPLHTLYTVSTLIVASSLAIMIAVKIYSKEGVLFKD